MTHYAGQYKRRFKWLRPDLFIAAACRRTCATTAEALLGVLERRAADGTRTGTPSSRRCTSCSTSDHPSEKVLVFTQFADTVRYLERRN